MIRIVKKYIKKLLHSLKTEEQKESAYYKNLFINNDDWNTADPNREELLRWEIIEGFLNEIYVKKQLKNISILDLGCGRGWLTNLLSTYGDVVGIEPVKAVVNHASKMFPNIKFICGTTKDLLKDKSFKKYDLIVSSEVIEHIPDKEKAKFIDDISILLNDRGYLIITTPRKEAEKEWNGYLTPNQPIEDWITEIDLEKLVVQKSFSKKQLKRYAISPVNNAPEIEIYQLWLFQKN